MPSLPHLNNGQLKTVRSAGANSLAPTACSKARGSEALGNEGGLERFAGSGGDDHRVGPTSPLTIGSLTDLLGRAASRRSDWVRMKSINARKRAFAPLPLGAAAIRLRVLAGARRRSQRLI
jgi:hypothetical protein